MKFREQNKFNSDLLNDFEEKINLLDEVEAIKLEFDSFGRQFSLIELLNTELVNIDKNKYYIPAKSLSNKIVLFSNEHFELSFIFNEPKDINFEGKVLYSYANDIFYCPLLNIENFKYTIYHQNLVEEPNCFNKNAKLEFLYNGFIIKNKTIFIEKFKEIIKLDKTKPFIVLALIKKENALSYCWEYDSETLMPNRIALLDVNKGRIDTSIKILGQIGNKKSLDILIGFTKSDSHFIRWEALRAIFKLDFPKGIAILKLMENDPHKEIQHAAKKALDNLKKMNKIN